MAHPRLRFGGSEAFATWTLEALTGDYRIALVIVGAIDLPASTGSMAPLSIPIDAKPCR